MPWRTRVRFVKRLKFESFSVWDKNSKIMWSLIRYQITWFLTLNYSISIFWRISAQIPNHIKIEKKKRLNMKFIGFMVPVALSKYHYFPYGFYFLIQNFLNLSGIIHTIPSHQSMKVRLCWLNFKISNTKFYLPI